LLEPHCAFPQQDSREYSQAIASTFGSKTLTQFTGFFKSERNKDCQDILTSALLILFLLQDSSPLLGQILRELKAILPDAIFPALQSRPILVEILVLDMEKA